MSPLIRRSAGPLLVAATGTAMLIWTWNTWPDPVTDFGKEVYIADQLAHGHPLYTAIAYHLGPFSPYFNAAAFKLFGSSLATLETLNFLVLAAIATLLYRLLHKIAGDFAAAGGCCILMLLFAFTHFTPITDYNYLAPYDHAHTHGLLLGLLALTLADAAARSGKYRLMFASGLALALAFLTRAELFVAAAVGTSVILLPVPWLREGAKIKSIPSPRIAWFSLGFMLPLFVVGMLLPFHALAGSWPVVLNRSVTGGDFYRDSMGTLHPAQSFTRLAWWTMWWAVIFIPPLLLRKSNPFLIALGFAYGAIAAFEIGLHNDFGDAFAPLPLAIAACFFFMPRAHRHLSAGLLVWSGLLLGKILLNARIEHYGFVLAMPATVLLVAIGFGWTRPVARATIAGVLIVVVYGYLFSPFETSALNLMRQQVYTVGQGANQFLADERGLEINQILTALAGRSSPGQTLAVMPEGAMLNFLTHLPTPTRYWSYQPPYAFFWLNMSESAAEGQAAAALEQHPPDWIVMTGPVLSHRINAFVSASYQPLSASSDFHMILLGRVYNGSHGIRPR